MRYGDEIVAMQLNLERVDLSFEDDGWRGGRRGIRIDGTITEHIANWPSWDDYNREVRADREEVL